MEENKAAGQQQEGNNNNKDQKKFEESLKLLLGILTGTEGGEKLLKKKKASTPLLDEVVAELMKDSDKQFKEKLKVDIQALIKGHMEFQDEVSKKRKELEKAEMEAKKRFTEKAQVVFQSVEDRGGLMKRTKDSVKAVTEAGTSQVDETEETDQTN